MSIYQPPDRVTIPAPMPVLRQRGKHATGERYGRNLKVRLSLNDRELIRTVARALDMTPAAFIRWCAVHVAKSLGDDIEDNLHS